MGEFTRAGAARGKNLAQAAWDVVTPANLAIAVVSALIGYVVVEYLRKKV